MKHNFKFLLLVFFITLRLSAQCDEKYGTIVISEIYFDTHYTEDIEAKYHSFGEYIELYNSSTEPINLNGWVIKDNHTEYKLVENDGSGNNLIIESGGFKIITYNGFYASNGHYGAPSSVGGRQKFLELFPLPNITDPEKDIILQNRMVLYNDVDKIAIYTPGGKLVDEVSYLNGQNAINNPNFNSGGHTPLEYLHTSIPNYTISLNPRINNTDGGCFNGAIGLIASYITIGFVTITIYIPTTNYQQAIYRADANNYNTNGGISFAEALATPMALPSGMTVALLPIDPLLFYNGTNLTDNDLNRTEATSYDIKTGLVNSFSKTYFDDLGRASVSLAQDYNTGLIWGTETLYDTFGRKQKESFPTTTCFGLNYINFLSNPIIKTNFLDRYYSDNNPLEPYQATAEQTFSEINYDILNPGNVINVVGGNKIQANPIPAPAEWKTGYSYTVPAAQEMYYVYGHNFFDGDVSATTGDEEIITKYYKTVNVDPNGVENVTFSDAEGRTLASAKSGPEAPYSYPVFSLIGTQGYIDVHIPNGVAAGNLLVSSSLYDVFDLQTGLPYITSGTLPAGHAYRVVAKTVPSVDPKVYVSHSGGALSHDATALGVSYNVNYYDYAINVYNKTGQLVKSIQPNAFHQVFPASISINATPTYMNTSFTNFCTQYAYNWNGEVITVSNPDEGASNFSYRKDGQIRFSRNALQGYTKMSYTNYDNYARPIESGVANYSNAFNDPDDTGVPIPLAGQSEQNFTIYDFELNNQTSVAIPANKTLSFLLTAKGLNPLNYIQKNLSGNVAITFTKPATDITAITWYSYDLYGRIDWIAQYNDGIGLKTIHYEYDYIGNVKKVIYEKENASEYFAHQYTYNLNDVLQKVETATSSSGPFTTHADYSYYVSGELKRVNIAQGAQGLDYVYTLSGALKSINHPSLEASKDPGGDANDVFGLTLDYYDGDYLRTGTNITTSNSGTPDYNGNIKAARWSNKQLDVINPNAAVGPGNLASQKGYTYNYNRNQFLTGASFGNVNTAATITPTNQFKEDNIEYDSNGNITKLKRTNQITTLVDDFTYNYTNAAKNQLSSVTDNAPVTSDPTDIDNQSSANYTYDILGQLTHSIEGDLYYNYNTQGLVTSVWKGTTTPLVKFYYNERGQKIKKESYNSAVPNALVSTDFYILDISGSIMAVYKKLGTSSTITQTELPIYGIERLGEYYKQSNTTQYEITDHLGNVRAVIRKDTANPTGVVVQSYNDFYPYGEALPTRNTAYNYRFAFQGQQLDSETGMEAFQLRLWDGRIGRWLSPDPAGQYFSPYLGMGNNPINRTDSDGGSDDPIGGWHAPFLYPQVPFGPQNYTPSPGFPGSNRAIQLKEVIIIMHRKPKNEFKFVFTFSFDDSWRRISAAPVVNKNNTAEKLLNSGRVTFGTLHPSPPDPKYKNDLANANDNIRDAANGNLVHTSEYGHAKGKLVKLSPRLLSLLDDLTDDYTIGISELAGARHSSNSRHYAGLAVDITSINGVPVNHSNIHFKALMARARALGATEVIGPGSPNHAGHVHIGMPRR